MTVAIAIALGIAHTIRQPLQTPFLATRPQPCLTLVADLNPPLNVRSQPRILSDNIIGKLNTGMSISVVREEDGWLLLNAPIPGWVYKRLTATSCSFTGKFFAGGATVDAGFPIDFGPELLAIATEQYHTGNLDAAISLARSIQSYSSADRQAQVATIQWQQDWQTAQQLYYNAQQALRDGQWQDVLDIVNTFPDIRFWREKLTPLVKEAIEQQHRSQTSL